MNQLSLTRPQRRVSIDGFSVAAWDSAMADELKGKNILLVDDDPDILDALRAALSDTGV